MNWIGRFTIVPAASLVIISGITSCQGLDSGAESEPPTAEAVSETVEAQAETAESTAETAHATEAPSAPRSPSPSPSETTGPTPDDPPAPAPPSPLSEPRQPAPPPPPPEPQIIEVTVPEGTVLELELLTSLDSSVNQQGDEIQARTLSPIYVDGDPVMPKGTYVEGRVLEVQASGRVKGRAHLAFTFERLRTRVGVKEIRTSYVDQEAESGQKKDATVVGGGAGLGAIVGGIIGGKKGAAIGAAIGGAGGTGVVLATKGEEIRLPVGTELNVRLDESVIIQLN